MTISPHLDDNRLSALIDGEADPGDVEHATACAECGARVAAWEEARRLVAAAPGPPPAPQRDAAVAAALSTANQPEAKEPATPVVSLAQHQIGPDRRRRPAWLPRAVAAVAAVLVIVGVVVAAVHAGGPGSSSHSSARGSSGAASGTSGQSPGPAAAAPSSPAREAPSSPAREVVHLGAVQGPGPLVAELRSVLGRNPAGPSPTSGSSAAPPDTAVTACLRPAVADVGLAVGTNPGLQASLTYQGKEAAAFVFHRGSQLVAVVVAVPACGLLAEMTF